MKRFFGFFMVLLCSFHVALAAIDVTVSGITLNQMLKIPLDSVKVVLVKDGAKLDSTYSSMRMVNGKMRAYFEFHKMLPGTYQCRFSRRGYEPTEVTFQMKKEYKFLDFVYLKPQPRIHTLGDAKVQSSRIKFYHKGDTLVFNADAFNLAEGSMLEALIDALPGVELKRNGEILVNGRRVDELFLNGKDFFRGDRLVLLENLPAYMVKDVKVYERDDPFRQRFSEKPLTMDVKLKKQYAEGWIANTELAGGTNERFLGRLFGLRFTDCSRLSLYGNVNNVNDSQKPGRSGDWQPQDALGGQQRTLKGGFDFRVESKSENWSFNTSNEVKHSRSNFEWDQANTTFLPTNTVYKRLQTAQLSHNTLWTSNNRWTQNFKNENQLSSKAGLFHQLNMSYRTFDAKGQSRAVEQDIPFDSLGTGWDLNRLISATDESEWFGHLLNRSTAPASTEGHEFKTDGWHSFHWRPKGNLLFMPNFIWNYHRSNTFSYQQKLIDYPAQQLQSPQSPKSYLHQHYSTPVEDYKLYGSLQTTYWLPCNVGVGGTVKYSHQYRSTDRSLFNLHNLEQWGADDRRSLTQLPSTRDSLQLALDARNSYYSTTYQNMVEVAPDIDGEIHTESQKVYYIKISLPLSIDHTRLFYQRGDIDAALRRTTRFLNPYVSFRVADWKKNTDFRIRYSHQITAPSLVYRLNLTDDVNPLNIQLGNDKLKNTMSHSLSAAFSRKRMKHQGSWSTELTYNLVRNALAHSVLYNELTGVRTTRPDNVNGNWNLTGSTHFYRHLDKHDRLGFTSSTGYSYLHSVDLTGTTAVERSKVNTLNLNEEVSLRYQLGDHSIGVKGKVAWSNITSDRENFTNMNVADFNYGLTALLQLPWKLQFSTDLTLYSRRGYESSSMNTDDLVWNARLSRTFLGGRLTCFVDGFDLLGNLSNVYRTVNAQGRTETRYNVVPRYAMFHVVYRLNKQPKKQNP